MIIRIVTFLLDARIEPRWLILTDLTNRHKGSRSTNSPNTPKLLDALDDALDLPSWGNCIAFGAAVGEAFRLARPDASLSQSDSSVLAL